MPRTRTAPAPWSPRFGEGPRFASLSPALARVAHFEAFPPVDALDDALGALLPRRDEGERYRLVAQRPSPRRGRGADVDALYDVVIDARGEIPTRPGDWHDLLNALVWASFPRAKSRLSARQHRLHRARAAARGPDARTLPGARTRAQDALALLDEGGALVLCARARLAPLEEALAASDLGALDEAEARGEARVLLFGHALFEHLVHGLAARASPHLLAVEDVPRSLDTAREAADVALAARLDDDADIAAPGRLAAIKIA